MLLTAWEHSRRLLETPNGPFQSFSSLNPRVLLGRGSHSSARERLWRTLCSGRGSQPNAREWAPKGLSYSFAWALESCARGGAPTPVLGEGRLEKSGFGRLLESYGLAWPTTYCIGASSHFLGAKPHWFACEAIDPMRMDSAGSVHELLARLERAKATQGPGPMPGQLVNLGVCGLLNVDWIWQHAACCYPSPPRSRILW